MNLKIWYVGSSERGNSTILYQPETREAFMLASTQSGRAVIRFTPTYDLGDELRAHVLESGMNHEIPDGEFKWLCEATQDISVLDGLNFDDRKAPNLVSLLDQYSTSAGVPPVASSSIF